MALHIFTEDIYVGKTQPTDTSQIWVETTGMKVNLFTQPKLQNLTFNPNIKEQLLAAGINIQGKLLQGWQIEETNFNIKQYNTITQQWEIVGNSSGEERLEGDGAEYYTLAPTALSFRSTAPLNELQEVQINGVTVDPSNYTLEEGSTIVTFPVEYLKTLNVGSYEVNIASESKSVKGNFTVAAPKLNEYGFYYNQPYVGYVSYYNQNWVFFFRENGALTFMILGTDYIEECSYTIENGSIVVTSVSGAFTGSATIDGIYCNEIATTFVLGDTSIVADEDYIYTYKEDLGGYEVNTIDKTKAEYGVIKTGVNGIDTVKLKDYMFENNTNLTTIPRIPSTITYIDVNLFAGCSNLSNIVIPKHIVSLQDSAFAGCTSLKSVTFEPDSQLTRIMGGVFSSCSSLETFTVPEEVVNIYDNAFRDCINLKSVNINTSIEYVDTSSFIGCSSLIYNEYGNVRYLGNDDNPYIVAIEPSNQDVTQCKINARTKVIAKGFCATSSITDITIEENSLLTYINPSAFWGSDIDTIAIPDSVLSIGESSFEKCGSLRAVTFGKNSRLANIEGAAFYECSSLTSVEIPDSVTNIGQSAFNGCKNLASVIISDSVTSIGGYAFKRCTSLTSIIFNGPMAQWNVITLGYEWNVNVPATHVQCSDGQVAL